MNRTDAIAWVLSVCASLRLSQAKTLADLVAAALGVGRISLAALGRRMARPAAAKHRIKRTWRFVANRRVEVSTAMQGVIARLVKRRRKPLIVSLDWTEIRGFCTLVAAATLAGRAVPLIWASYPKGVLFRSQNSLEEGLLRLLRTLIPPKVPVILLALDMPLCREATPRAMLRIGRHVKGWPTAASDGPSWPAAASSSASTTWSASAPMSGSNTTASPASCWTIRCSAASAVSCGMCATASTGR